MIDINDIPTEDIVLTTKGKLIKENFFELDDLSQGFIVEEYLKTVEYDYLQGILRAVAHRDIEEGFSRHDFMEAASSAYSDLKADDEFEEEEDDGNQN